MTAGYELQKQGGQPLLFEKGHRVGGIARTESYRGFRFDIGGHRFYTKASEVERIWHELLGDDFLKCPRLSRIHYNGKFYKYPLNLLNTLTNLGFIESSLILLSYLRWQVKPYRYEETFEQWVTNRFGRRLYETFFKSYTEKVWGVPCSAIRAEWAAQRIKGLSLKSAVINAIFGTNNIKSLIEEFYYPRLGPGMMWEKMQQTIESRGGAVHLSTEVVRLNLNNHRVESVFINKKGRMTEIKGDQYISSMPLLHLICRLNPAPAEPILQAARALKHRDFLMVVLILDQAQLFPDNWIYIHSSEVNVGRIQNFKNWSPDMVPDPNTTSLGLEYFCSEGDAVWESSDEDLIQLASQELVQLGLARAGDIVDGTVIRQRKAYPVYDAAYRQHLQTLQAYLGTITNLQTVGRNGLHRYNNQDHSMLTGLLAARNVLGEKHNVWAVNTDRSYYEEFKLSEVKTITRKL